MCKTAPGHSEMYKSARRYVQCTLYILQSCEHSIRRVWDVQYSILNQFRIDLRTGRAWTKWKKKCILHIHTTYMRLKSIHKFTIWISESLRFPHLLQPCEQDAISSFNKIHYVKRKLICLFFYIIFFTLVFLPFLGTIYKVVIFFTVLFFSFARWRWAI